MNQTVHENKNCLSIRFASDGFSILISDQNHTQISKKTVASNINQLTETELIDLLSNQPELHLSFKTVRLIAETNIYTIIPYVFFKKEEMYELLKFQHPALSKSETTLSNFLEIWDAVNVFSIPKTLTAVLQKFLPEIPVEHHLTTFLTDYIALQNGKNIHIWIRSNEMDVVVLQSNKLHLINTFNYLTAEDFVFNTINIIQQLGLNAEECNVFLYNSEQSYEINKMLQSYVSECKIIS